MDSDALGRPGSVAPARPAAPAPPQGGGHDCCRASDHRGGPLAVATDRRLTAAELHALLLLAGARDPLGGGAVQLPIRELARAMGVNASTASRRLARLRRLGLVRAWSDPTHRQASAYTLTRLDAAPAASSEERA